MDGRYHADGHNIRVDAELRLDPDGDAELVDFPTGVSVTDEDGLVCFEPSAGYYTGPAEWSVVNGYRIALEFGDSHIEVSTGKARFSAQNWSEIRFQECGSRGVVWWFSVQCGDPGTSYPDDLAACRED